MDEKFLIVIGRQFGSGGKRIGKLVAERLGVDYYDKELLTEAAVKYGFSPKIFAAADERRPSPFRSLLHLVLGASETPFSPETLSAENLYAAQSSVIKSICGENSCVMVGRTADYVMRDHPMMLSVFLHAPIEYRRRIVLKRESGLDEAGAEDLARKNDSQRESYYNYFTGRRWGTCANYHLSIDSSLFTDEEVAEMIVEALRLKQKEKK